MPVYRLPRAHAFPDPHEADDDGLIAVGGDLHPDRVLLAYRMGIFPWYSEGQPILWWSPDPRTVLEPAAIHVPRSLAKRMRRGDYQITLDTAFERVIGACAERSRPGQDSTWITDEMQAAYIELHAKGFAHSCEAWRDGELVGGLYGIALGKLFCGESMFAMAPDASKSAFVTLTRQLHLWGFELIDCQMRTDHLARFGAVDLPREAYLEKVAALGRLPGRVGRWQFDDGLAEPTSSESA